MSRTTSARRSGSCGRRNRGAEDATPRFDGKKKGAAFYENDEWHASRRDNLSLPMLLKKGEGLEFHCGFEKNSDKSVRWGFGAEDEMCQLGLVITPSSTTAACEVNALSKG